MAQARVWRPRGSVVGASRGFSGKLAGSLLLLAVSTGCSLAGGRGVPEVTPAAPEDDEVALALAVVERAFQAIGTPYEWGGTDANGFDCSGLIRFAYGEFGIELPRISRDQLRMGSPVDPRVGALQPGDILGFSAVVGGEATHVGLYVGDGEFIHSSTGGVRVSDLREPYWQQHFVKARRMVRMTRLPKLREELP